MQRSVRTFGQATALALAALITIGIVGSSAALGQSNSAQFCRDRAETSMQSHDAEKRKQQADVVAQYQVDMRNCGKDANCKSAATQRYHDRQREIANQDSLARAAIRKQEIDCNQAFASLRPIGPARMDPRGEPLTGNATQTNVQTGTGVYNPGMGTRLPAMHGEVQYGPARLSVSVAAGKLVGQGIAGPVQLVSHPRIYSRAEGFVHSAAEFRITKLWDLGGRLVNLPGRIDGQYLPVPIVPR